MSAKWCASAIIEFGITCFFGSLLLLGFWVGELCHFTTLEKVCGVSLLIEEVRIFHDLC